MLDTFLLAVLLSCGWTVFGAQQCSPPYPNVNFLTMGEKMSLFLFPSEAIYPALMLRKLDELEERHFLDRIAFASRITNLKMDDFSAFLDSFLTLFQEVNTEVITQNISDVLQLDGSYTTRMKACVFFSTYQPAFQELYEVKEWVDSCPNSWVAAKALREKLKLEVKHTLSTLAKHTVPMEGFRKRLGEFLDNEGLLGWEDDILETMLKGTRKLYEETQTELWGNLQPLLANWKQLNSLVQSESGEFDELLKAQYFPALRRDPVIAMFSHDDKNTTFVVCPPLLEFIMRMSPGFVDLDIDQQIHKLQKIQDLLSKYEKLSWFTRFVANVCPMFENVVAEDWFYAKMDQDFLRDRLGMSFNKLLDEISIDPESLMKYMEKLTKILIGKDVSFALPDEGFL